MIKKNVSLLGGSFDPPTLGHVAVAESVLTHLNVKEVWWVPCHQHAFGKKLTNHHQRITMCQYAIENEKHIKVFDYEFMHQIKKGTFYFLTILLNDPIFSKKFVFSYIIGMDNANHFNKWINYKQLKTLIPFIVVSRTGEKPNPKIDWYLKPPHVYLQSNIPNTASSQIRSACAAHDYKTAQSQLNPKVWKFITEKNLYQ